MSSSEKTSSSYNFKSVTKSSNWQNINFVTVHNIFPYRSRRTSGVHVIRNPAFQLIDAAVYRNFLRKKKRTNENSWQYFKIWQWKYNEMFTFRNHFRYVHKRTRNYVKSCTNVFSLGNESCNGDMRAYLWLSGCKFWSTCYRQNHQIAIYWPKMRILKKKSWNGFTHYWIRIHTYGSATSSLWSIVVLISMHILSIWLWHRIILCITTSIFIPIHFDDKNGSTNITCRLKNVYFLEIYKNESPHGYLEVHIKY